MRLTSSILKGGKHNDTVTCIGWLTSEDFLSCSDDGTIFKWNITSGEANKYLTLPPNLYPTDFHIPPKSGARQGHEYAVITSSDGKFHLLAKNGRIERSFEGHKGAVLVGQWSPDGSGLLTGGEDGLLKIWSKTGMLRSTVVQSTSPVYSAAWSSDVTQVIFCQGKSLILKPLAANTKPSKWKAHDGLILKIAWDYINDLIVSGGEDCRYKVWDTMGRQIYSSAAHDYPITSIAWSPNGTLFAVGSFNTLRLCDKSGWSHSLEKPLTGSLNNMAWSTDGTQLAAACANGSVLVAQLIDRSVEWGYLEAVVQSKNSVQFQNLSTDEQETLDFQERILHLALAYGHLVVVTPSQCYIYSVITFNTPIIIDLREGGVANILLSEKNLLLVEKSSINLYSYDGRLVSSPRWPAFNVSTLNPSHLALSIDSVGVRDQADDRVVHMLDTNGKEISTPYSHTTSIIEIGLSQGPSLSDRLLTLVDKNRDLFLVSISAKVTQQRRAEKLGSIVHSFKWNSRLDILAAMQNSSLCIWYFPHALFTDQKLIKKSTFLNESGEFGRNPTIVSFVDNSIGIRRADGALLYSSILPHISILNSLVRESAWKRALRLCRMVKSSILWAYLAGEAIRKKDPVTAETAYAAIHQNDNVAFFQQTKALPSRSEQIANIFLLGGNIIEAENALLQNGLVFKAIQCNITCHNWNRALELAVRHKTHVDSVLYLRRKYLETFGKQEISPKFITLGKEVPIHEDEIERKIALELEKGL